MTWNFDPPIERDDETIVHDDVTCPQCGSTDCTYIEQKAEGYWGESLECHSCGLLEERTPQDARRTEDEREAVHRWRMEEAAQEKARNLLGVGPDWPDEELFGPGLPRSQKEKP